MGGIENLYWLGHASFYIKSKGSTIFIDPFQIKPSIKEKADLVLITHAHFDHCNPEDVRKVLKPEGEIICSPGCFEDGSFKNFTTAKPGFSTNFKGVEINAIPAYNIKPERLNFHPKANNWVGYILNVDNFRIYHAGDTDFINEMKQLKGIGASLLPMGGTYTMDVDEAIEAMKVINPKYAVPMHYKGPLRGNFAEAEEKFKKSLSNAHIMKEVQ